MFVCSGIGRCAVWMFCMPVCEMNVSDVRKASGHFGKSPIVSSGPVAAIVPKTTRILLVDVRGTCPVLCSLCFLLLGYIRCSTRLKIYHLLPDFWCAVIQHHSSCYSPYSSFKNRLLHRSFLDNVWLSYPHTSDDDVKYRHFWNCLTERIQTSWPFDL